MLAPEIRTVPDMAAPNCVHGYQLFLCTVETVIAGAQEGGRMSVEFLWGERAQPTRGPKPALTLERIADAAVAVADAEGLAAVSMQRVAAELGKTKMSLYRYLPGKAELVALMVEQAIGEPPELRAGGWREALTEWSELLFAAYLRHPWAVGATVG